MANYNKVILVGNLTRDPQLSYLPSQTPVIDFGMAVNRNWTGQDGQRREETCFVDLRAYGKPAEIINHYMSKGRQLLVEGRLQFQQWQAQDGTRRSKHIVVVENFQFLGGPGGAGPRDANADNAQVGPPRRTQPPDRQAAGPGPEQTDETEATENAAPPAADQDTPAPPKGDDIPF